MYNIIKITSQLFLFFKKSKDDAFLNEHEYFLKAKNDLQKHHHDEVTKVNILEF